ncbi:MAG TPA: hypothetical protein VNT99_21195 [Methylomirabilota bacterium]|nr:hypothetical protein [Methylomirabilota bacterium]
MNFVLDTNAVSETRKPRPNAGLLDWHSAQDPAHLFLTTITLAEVWQGFHALDSKHPDYERIKNFCRRAPAPVSRPEFRRPRGGHLGRDHRAHEIAAALARFVDRCHRPLAWLSCGDSRHGAVRARRLQGGQSVEVKPEAVVSLHRVSAGQIRPRARRNSARLPVRPGRVLTGTALPRWPS